MRSTNFANICGDGRSLNSGHLFCARKKLGCNIFGCNCSGGCKGTSEISCTESCVREFNSVDVAGDIEDWCRASCSRFY